MSAVAQARGERRARRLARSHYENFPVASWLLPRAYRTPVALLYAFARRADDIADEGERDTSERLQALHSMRRQLDYARAGAPCSDPQIGALAAAMHDFDLPWQYLYDLLAAFTQDLTVKRYADFDGLAAYCALSANPIGRLLLHLYDAVTDRNLLYSDAICTSLQLINFLQDVDADFHDRDRLYIPLDEMTRFGVDETDVRDRRTGEPMRRLVDFQRQRAASLLDQGAPLARILPGRCGRELRAIVAGGNQILKRLRRRADPFQRPRLRTGDWIAVAWSALRP